ncbi:MAG: L-lactate dehydrogenase (quinone) large subunit LdhH [Armatimonadota bacterium]
MAESKAHRRQVRDALTDQNLQTALKRAALAYRTARAEAMAGFDLEAAQDAVRSIKERSVADLDGLFARFKQEAQRVGTVVYEARDGREAAEIIQQLAHERGVRLIVKSKSMLTEEIELNDRLGGCGLEVVETDLGEWIVQLAGEKPSHFTMPAMHKTREEIARLLSEATGEEVAADIPELVRLARRLLRRQFVEADMGISGANIAIAETGTLVIVSNEGNARLVTALPPIHVAVVGYEKLVGTLEEATAILKVLARSASGQKMSAYVSYITGPSRTTDIEKTLTLGVHGPTEVHVVFVDAGRKAMAADDKLREALYCIKCGACLNLCPVYNSIGGHAYANAYVGGIGTVLTAHHRNLDAVEETVGLCSGCASCRSVCPSRIDVPGMILELRRRLVETRGMPFSGKLSMTAIRHPGLLRGAARMARALQKPVIGQDRTLRELPLVTDLLGGKKMPGLASRFLREILSEKSANGAPQRRSPGITVSLFAGCLIDFVYPEIGEAVWKVLEAGNVTAAFPSAQSCCGAPALYVGDFGTARKLAIDNVEAMTEARPDYVVTGCPTCAVMLREQFPALLAGTPWHERAVSLAAKVRDFAQFAMLLPELVAAVSSAPVHLREKVTYHEPCHQSRGLVTSACSRELIARSGMQLIEMTDADECCGFAGSYSIKQPGISAAILERKLAHIAETGAQVLATDCPGCIMQIRGGLAARESTVRVCHTAQLVADLVR